MKLKVVFALVSLFAWPMAAEAQAKPDAGWTLTPFIGYTTGGQSASASPTVGVTARWMGQGRLGLEGDVAWSPEFFAQDGFLTRRTVLTQMANVVVTGWHARSEHLQPFVSGGLGIVHVKLTEAGGFADLNERKFGWNAGGGAILCSARLCASADLRYFRSATGDRANAFDLDLSTLGFWRIVTGVVVRP